MRVNLSLNDLERGLLIAVLERLRWDSDQVEADEFLDIYPELEGYMTERSARKSAEDLLRRLRKPQRHGLRLVCADEPRA